jgi:hypothetical protein
MKKVRQLRRFLTTHTCSAQWDYDGHKENECYKSFDDPQKDWNQTLMTKINQVSAQIFQANLRAGANVVIIGEDMLILFVSLEYMVVSHDIRNQEYYNLGRLAGRYDVYVVPELFLQNKIYVCNLFDVNKGIFKLKNYSKVAMVWMKKSF